MPRHANLLLLALLVLAPASAWAQLGLPVPQLPRAELPVKLPKAGPLSLDRLGATLEQVRIDRLTRFVSGNRKAVEWDGARNPAVRGQLLVTAVDDTAIAKAAEKGFVLLSREQIEGLDLSYVRFALPKGMDLEVGLKKLRALLPDAEVDADHIYFQSGSRAAATSASTALANTPLTGVSLGLIDGGVADHASVSGRVEQKGFATGAPLANSHGTSVAALMIGKGIVRGGAPGAKLLAADVYGSDKAGGNATAIAKALGWLVGRGVSVVTISLVGPDNAILRQAVASASRKGVIIVAAVGNDGPASPQVYPASYAGVLAITAVDAKNKGLPEAGRASHTDFAAPGAGISSALGADRTGKVRGTSYAAPLVAGRLSLLYGRPAAATMGDAVNMLAAEAIDLGKEGYDPVYGYGLVCSNCVTR